MPLVNIVYSEKVVGKDFDQIKRQLNSNLPSILSKVFNIPNNEDANVEPQDIIVHHRISDKADVNTKDIEVYVFTEGFPERMDRVNEHGHMIFRSVEMVAEPRGLTGFVWILPLQGTWFRSF